MDSFFLGFLKTYIDMVEADESINKERYTSELLKNILCIQLWKGASNITPQNPYIGMSYILIAIQFSTSAAVGHSKEATYTDEEAEKWRTDVLKHLKALVKLLHRPPHQFYGFEHHFRANIRNRSRLLIDSNLITFKYPSLFHMLIPDTPRIMELLHHVIKKVAKTKTTIPKRPGGETVSVLRRRFCLEMGTYFPSQLPGKERLIADFASAIFIDSESSDFRPEQVKILNGPINVDSGLKLYRAFFIAGDFESKLGFDVNQAEDVLRQELVERYK